MVIASIFSIFRIFCPNDIKMNCYFNGYHHVCIYTDGINLLCYIALILYVCLVDIVHYSCALLNRNTFIDLAHIYKDNEIGCTYFSASLTFSIRQLRCLSILFLKWIATDDCLGTGMGNVPVVIAAVWLSIISDGDFGSDIGLIPWINYPIKLRYVVLPMF